VLTLLDASIPLCVTEARLACMTVSDNALFCRVGQRYDAFLSRTGTDKVLLGGTDAVDTVSVIETRGSATAAAAAFSVRFSITQFQLRVRVQASKDRVYRAWYVHRPF
jgi:hypothetical protein